MLRMWSGKSFACALMRVNCAVLLLLSQYTLQKARADGPMVIQNDRLAGDTTQAWVFGGFQANDVGAAVFTLPAGVDAFLIQSVQVLWGSDVDPCLDTTYVNLNLYKGIVPSPGAPVHTIPGLAMQAGGFNQIMVDAIRYMKDRDGNPNPDQSPWWVYRSDGPFAIGVEYLTAWTQAGYDPYWNTYPDSGNDVITEHTGHLMLDTQGCEPGKNLVYDAATQSWIDPVTQQLPGNFAIRLVGQAFASKAPFGDWDKDGDVDQEDFGAFQACWTGPSETATPECAAAFDCARDGHIDTDDLEQFNDCSSGPEILASATCGQCFPLQAMTSVMTLDSIMALSSSDLKDGPQRIGAWGLLVLVLIFLVALFLIYDYGTNPRSTAARAWTTATGNAYCPSATQLQTLRTFVNGFAPGGAYNTVINQIPGGPPPGAEDPMATAVYQVLDAALKDCNTGMNRIFLIPSHDPVKGDVVNRTGVYATVKMKPFSPGDELFFFTDQYVDFGGTPRWIQMLFAEGDHVATRTNPNIDHADLQQRLLDFAVMHDLNPGGPMFKHGKQEGMQNP